MEPNDMPTLPVARGDWVESRDSTRPRIAKVVRSYWDTAPDGARRCIVDLALYSDEGTRIGRESPAAGGPRMYEPFLEYADWFRIEKPEFPVSLRWVDNGDGSRSARYVTGAKALPDRAVAPRVRAKAFAARSIPKNPNSDYDPELEVRSRRMAAQELRGVNARSPDSALMERAERLENEARAIAIEHGMER